MPTSTAQYPDHPAASLMPNMTEEEFQALKADIKQHGLREPILIFNGQVVDGRHRLRACRDLRIKPQIKELTCQEQDLPGLVRSLNFHRRHLTREQRQAIVRQQLKETPDRSDRQIAKELGVSPTTVGTARKYLEEVGQLSKLDSSIGADGKARKRPVAGVDLELLESLGSTEKMVDVLALIKKNKIPEQYHAELIDLAANWLADSIPTHKAGTSIAVKGDLWWESISGEQSARLRAIRERIKQQKLTEKLSTRPVHKVAAEIISDYARMLRKTKEPDEHLEMVAPHLGSVREEELQKVQGYLIRLDGVLTAKADRIKAIIRANNDRLQAREKEVNPFNERRQIIEVQRDAVLTEIDESMDRFILPIDEAGATASTPPRIEER